ncbi:MAG: 2-C-methyl-D-erythritol 4-phosphate cytidylyltransferase [SAR86 cluster bacterium]|uniref:2-C-methyl-D-erythritol 4-phosphate cytidylyltransferase n=1 Tax=SAR86 cluster bacterium TaxID=2030880 RepID=A0A2A4MLJ8_9GAMM|nr:MAG: 2-C-methyl-D-erythritol 4-phosphate cytidylyltransferase [SAR86 cluster bacterium]
MTIWAIVPAAGVGRRMGTTTPKQYLLLNQQALIVTTLARLASVEQIKKIIVMLNPEDKVWPTLGLSNSPKIDCQLGGDERYVSVLNGLHYLSDFAAEDDWVLVHDAVRPCVRVEDINELIRQSHTHSVGALLAAPVENTLKKADSKGEVAETVDRSAIWNAFTPQIFRFEILYRALKNVVERDLRVTDEASAVELLGLAPKLVLGNKDNIKITQAIDLGLAEHILKLQDEQG